MRLPSRTRTTNRCRWKTCCLRPMPDPRRFTPAIGHLDVVEARREDRATGPFQIVEKNGYFYGRGTQDMKVNTARVLSGFMSESAANVKPFFLSAIVRNLLVRIHDEQPERRISLCWEAS